MKKITFLFLLVAGTIFSQQRRNCHSMENLEYRQSNDPQLQHRMQQIESFTQNKLRQLSGLQGRIDGDIITIPVVVHIIYSNSQENISTAQIQSQIDVLNEDFRRTNSDATNKWSQAADTQIEFQLAAIDPNGNPTNGITRKSSTRTSWGTNDAMKSSAQGGVSPWDTSEYLNMWVCNIGGGILGYAQFPGGSASTDGVVMSPQYFGSSDKGSGFYLSAPFDKGRTTTHEVGHFLNLRHIWGDGGCGVDDFVSDTPTAGGANYGCATGNTSCGSEDMVENYMDYSDDGCMNLFTLGQKNRMRAVLEAGGSRRSLALSDKFTPVACNATTPTGVSVSGVSSSGATVSWNAVTGATYDVRYRATGTSSWTVNAVSATSAAISGLSASTQYEVQVRSKCSSGNSSYSASANFTTTAVQINYCASQGNNVSDEYISNVTLGSINNDSGSGNGYSNFTSISTNLSKSSSASITITPTWTGTVYAEGYAVFIDYNQDGDFADSGETVWTQAATRNTPVTGSFTVPAGATEGATRMRVSMKYNGVPTSCETFTYGEVEDYTVNITSGGSNPDPGCDTLNFNDYTLTSFSNQDSAGNASVGSGGNSLTLTNNTWKYIALNYTVTPNTVIEFDFTSTSQGEIHGVGFENDNSLTSSRYFKVHGTQNYGVTNYDNYAGGTKTYVIPVGDSYTGAMDRLVFINDNDAGSGNNSTFSNVKIYETSCSSSRTVVEFGARIDVLGDQDEDTLTALTLAPNPVAKGNILQVLGTSENTDLSKTNYAVVNMLGQVVKKGNLGNGFINTNALNSGVYILNLTNEYTNTSKRFVIR
ncbi:GEVED domain-containing protein [uncultured Tenacibaculum sp.]|uniref:GEVED domain-containing protein n=1 Tax=uncultured Tenacibaculum sp. TaxID=174713 RepID=UPI0026228FB4|nr:GEVED domain-containing protein [uncultured Tenacibaculum sp.]